MYKKQPLRLRAAALKITEAASGIPGIPVHWSTKIGHLNCIF